LYLIHQYNVHGRAPPMSTYGPLSGSGIQALSAGVGALHVHINALPTAAGEGNANPANFYHVGFIRAGDGTAWWRAIPIEATDAWIGLPSGATQIGYWVNSGGSITVTEVIGNNPFAGPQGPSGAAGAAGATGPAGPGVPAGGTTAQVLSKSSNADYDTAWVTPSSSGGGTPSTKGCRVYRSTDQALTANSWQALSFSAARFNTDTNWASGNPTRMTCHTAGVYMLWGGVGFQNTPGQSYIGIRINGTNIIAQQDMASPTWRPHVSTIWQMAVNDYAEVIVYVTATASAKALGGTDLWSPEGAMVLLSTP
jgi:hypothetical protein